MEADEDLHHDVHLDLSNLGLRDGMDGEERGEGADGAEHHVRLLGVSCGWFGCSDCRTPLSAPAARGEERIESKCPFCFRSALAVS